MRPYMLRMLRREDRHRLTNRATLTRGTWPDIETVDGDLPCLVRPSLRAEEQVSSGGSQYGMHMYDIRVPYDTDVRRGDVITITRARDLQMVGRWLTVVEATIDEELTSKKVVCEESVA